MDTDTESNRPKRLVDNVNTLCAPAQIACMQAFMRFGAWQAADNQRRQQQLPESQEHLAEGVRVMSELRDLFGTAQQKMLQAAQLANLFLGMLNERGDELVRMGANPDDIALDKTQLEERRDELRQLVEALKTAHEAAQQLPVQTGELLFAVAERDAVLNGRPVQMQ
jgi:hypothetical protein